MTTLSLIIAIISLLASIVTLFAVWGNIANYCFNRKNFKNGGLKVTCNSGEYELYTGHHEQLIYRSSDREEDFVRKREIGKIEHYEKIKPFEEWATPRKFDDIREPNYPLRLL